MRPPISSQTPETLSAWLSERGEKPYRAAQILKWVHQHFASEWGAMSNLPEPLQSSLGEAFDFSTIELARKQLVRLTSALAQSRVRLDAVRLIWKGPPESIGGA